MYSFFIIVIKFISISGITNFLASALSIFKQWFITKLIHHNRYRIQMSTMKSNNKHLNTLQFNSSHIYFLCHFQQTNKTKNKTDAINKLNCIRKSFSRYYYVKRKTEEAQRESTAVVCDMVRIDWNVVHFAYNGKQWILQTRTKWRQCALSLDIALKYRKKNIIIFVWNENKSYIILDTR